MRQREGYEPGMLIPQGLDVPAKTISDELRRTPLEGVGRSSSSCRHSLPAVMVGTSTPHEHKGVFFFESTGILASVGRAPNGGAPLGKTQTQNLTTIGQAPARLIPTACFSKGVDAVGHTADSWPGS